MYCMFDKKKRDNNHLTLLADQLVGHIVGIHTALFTHSISSLLKVKMIDP